MGNSIDPTVSLAFSVHSSKGLYALLIGSGVSRSAGILTGWEITLDLIKKLSVALSEDSAPNPETWYATKFGRKPEYSSLLDEIAKTQSERAQLLRSYFEPSDADRDQGLKVPTAAHTAIADLVLGGYVRVIVTTNFDRLIENALEARGISPTVISTPDAAEGALPLAHIRCAVIKVNGDYLDPRIKNTEAELGTYDERMAALIDRVFDEYGLVVCGWSGEWDTALRRSIERCKNHLFTTYWTTLSQLSEVTKNLVTLRLGQVITIPSADAFFRDLAGKVSAIEDFSELAEPLTTKVAIAQVKRFIVRPDERIRLREMVMTETERVYADLGNRNFPANAAPPIAGEMARRVQQFEKLSEVLRAMLIHGSYWGEQEDSRELWADCIQRIVNLDFNRAFDNALTRLFRYPAFLLAYASGIASVAGGHYDTLALTFFRPKVRGFKDSVGIVYRLHCGSIITREAANLLFGGSRYTPLNDHVYSLLREPFREYLPDDKQYDECFDRFEYFLALVQADTFGIETVQFGRFAWKVYENEEPPWERIAREAAPGSGVGWPPLTAGLFSHGYDHFLSANKQIIEKMRTLQWY